MKADEFKKILKPLIKQTIREVLLEEGVLSKVVSEVARGLSPNTQQESLARNTQTRKEDLEREAEDLERARQERIKRLNESTGMVGTNIFEGVHEVPESSGNGPLSGVRSADSGVDISAIQKLSNGKWKALLGGK
jgi:hypothetical protein